VKRFFPIFIFFLISIFICGNDINSARQLKIVCLAPNLCEITFALGCGDLIVGVSDFCEYPPECEKKLHVGGLLNPNFEAIISSGCNVAFLVPEEKWIGEKLKNFGIKYYVFRDYTISDILDSIKKIGDITGKREKAREIFKHFVDEVNRLKKENKSLKKRKKILVVVGRSEGKVRNVYIAGKGTFLDEIIQLAGGKNCYNGKLKYPQVGVEGILSMNPDVIFELIPDKNFKNKTLERMKRDWMALSEINAVKNGRIFFIEDTSFVVPGMRFLDAVKKLKAYLNND